MNLPPLDQTERAVLFADMNKHRNKFCAKVSRQYQLLGYVTPAQVRVVLQIQKERVTPLL